MKSVTQVHKIEKQDGVYCGAVAKPLEINRDLGCPLFCGHDDRYLILVL